jgi:hypothetical protein
MTPSGIEPATFRFVAQCIYIYIYIYSFYLYVNDAGRLTVTENRKHVTDRIFFVNECEDVREEVLNGEIGEGREVWGAGREVGL